MIKIFIDAATHQSKALSAGGMVLIKDNKQEQIHQPLSASTNNEAEFEMLVFALTHLRNQSLTNEIIFIYTDSKIVIESLQKKYAKDPRFSKHLATILELSSQFPTLFIEWIDEKDNKGADNLARQGLQKALKSHS
ncbi:ribonuclease HI family protein [Vagococcus sp. DIV0080]|uniref:Ribonuclease HI family protein n=1 Tax=Candidatus Vagococcus giribetii TaxID=2230876 RepID=A0ABS3HR71_9ENTE|nr:ribonuclease HI family protein [Vagococcus sp. DIV0080]MBO0476245.1 ribonuclease HI family protein [Vagococcus sp. DIV0080]